MLGVRFGESADSKTSDFQLPVQDLRGLPSLHAFCLVGVRLHVNCGELSVVRASTFGF